MTGRVNAEWVRRLHTAGKRLTPERELLLRIIDQNAHLDAAEIFRLARSENSKIGFATVYRTLKLLDDLDLVEASGLGEDHSHYEIRQHDHVHLVCLRCGKIHGVSVPSGLRSLGKSVGFDVRQAHLELIGYCRTCRREIESRRNRDEEKDVHR